MSAAAMVSENPSLVVWRELRDAARQAAGWGWPVTPGAYTHPKPHLVELVPAYSNWEQAAITNPDQAFSLWDLHSMPVLLVCGQGVDVLEVPSSVAELLASLAGANLTVPVLPIAEVTPPPPPPPRWMLFVATGTGTVRRELTDIGLRLRGRGRWVALPPTRLGHVKTRWSVPPPHCDFVLPKADHVQAVLLDAWTTEHSDAHD